VGIPLTKCMSGEDLSRLVEELAVVESLFHAESPQDPARKWEYSMALRAGKGLNGSGIYPHVALDVGGAGSPLVHMLTRAGYSTHVVDPKVNRDLAAAVAEGVQADFVTCISVIEHVEDLMQFVWELQQVVRSGGRLFLTCDIWDQDETAKDTAQFHWMRERIFTPKTWQMVAEEFRKNGFEFYGGQEWEYRGEQLYGSYSFASLSLAKQ
jgi:SAM-dependent methyltransferase